MSCKLNGGSRKRRSVRKSRKNRSRRGGIGFGNYQYDIRGNAAKAMGKDEDEFKKDRGIVKGMGEGARNVGKVSGDFARSTMMVRGGKRKTRRSRKSRRSRRSRRSRKSGGGLFSGLFGSSDKEEEKNQGGGDDLAVTDSADGMGPGQNGGKRRRRKSRKSRKSRKGRKSRR